jgi:glyoxalase superfamily protein
LTGPGPVSRSRHGGADRVRRCPQRVAQDTSIDRSIRWEKARLLDTMGYPAARHPARRSAGASGTNQRADPTWPSHDVPMQMHLDFTVSSLAELERQRERAESLGAHLLLDRTDDPDEPLYVLADPSGHPFCIFVA